jgi:hypothetical protein
MSETWTCFGFSSTDISFKIFSRFNLFTVFICTFLHKLPHNDIQRRFNSNIEEFSFALLY